MEPDGGVVLQFGTYDPNEIQPIDSPPERAMEVEGMTERFEDLEVDDDPVEEENPPSLPVVCTPPTLPTSPSPLPTVTTPGPLVPTDTTAHASGSSPASLNYVRLAEVMKMASAFASDKSKIFTADLSKTGNDDLEQQFENWQHNLGALFRATGTTDPIHMALVANTLLSGRAFNKIRKLSPIQDGLPLLPTYQEMVQHLKSLLKGTSLGDVALTWRIIKYDMLQAGLHTAKTTQVTPDLMTEWAKFQKEIEKRTIPPDDISLCAFYLHAFRSIPEIQDLIKSKQDEEGVMVEQQNPDHITITLQQHDDKYKSAVNRAVRNSEAWVQVNSNKRRKTNYNPSDTPTTKPTKPTSNGKVTKKAWNPFHSLNKSSLTISPPNTKDYRAWIKGSTAELRKTLSAEKRCWLCKTGNHMLEACPHKKQKFQAEEFCFYPKNLGPAKP